MKLKFCINKDYYCQYSTVFPWVVWMLIKMKSGYQFLFPASALWTCGGQITELEEHQHTYNTVEHHWNNAAVSAMFLQIWCDFVRPKKDFRVRVSISTASVQRKIVLVLSWWPQVWGGGQGKFGGNGCRVLLLYLTPHSFLHRSLHVLDYAEWEKRRERTGATGKNSYWRVQTQKKWRVRTSFQTLRMILWINDMPGCSITSRHTICSML